MAIGGWQGQGSGDCVAPAASTEVGKQESFSVSGSGAEKTHLQDGVAVAEPLIRLRNAWVAFLERYRFDWFATLSFREQPHPEHADKLWRLWIHELNVQLYGRRWHCKVHGGVFWIRSSELQKRGVLHFHALMGDVEDLNARARRLSRMDRWHQLAGIARITQIENDAAVSRYCAKYITKGGEIELSGNLSSYAQQAVLARSQR